ncbi:MAG: AAA family ATPase [Candidatus Aminicenantes bacterium]|jgi:predicted ATPase
MLVTFKNTGMIKEADIRLDGLTVIAGENDTGKSTIAKLLFCIIKTFNRAEEYGKSTIERKIKNLIEDYYDTFRKKADNAAAEMAKNTFNQIENHAIQLLNIAEDKIEEKEKIKANISNSVNEFMNASKRISDIEIDIQKIADQILDIIASKQEKEDVFKRSFQSFILSAFSDEIVNKYDRNQKYFITGKQGKNIIFEISGTYGTADLRLNDKLYFQDVTFIESPILLNLSAAITSSKTMLDIKGDTKKKVELLEKAYVAQYVKDFILKLTDRKMEGMDSGIIGDIRQIINGNFYYDQIEKEFILERGNKIFKGLSIASGIMLLGSISILYQGGFLNKKTLLIIDEPENHIHPQWLIRLAEVLVKLVKEGIPILLISHSPYLIEAVKLYSDHYLKDSQRAFYLSEKKIDKFESYVSNVTHDISPIFEILAKPFDKLELLQLKDTV